MSNIDLDDDGKKIYLNRIRSLLVEHIYSNGGEKIDINKLCNAIDELNQIINYDNKIVLPTISRSKHSKHSKTRKSPRAVTSFISKSRSRSKSRSKSRNRSRSKSKKK